MERRRGKGGKKEKSGMHINVCLYNILFVLAQEKYVYTAKRRILTKIPPTSTLDDGDFAKTKKYYNTI